jgi:hypothetical protein
LLSCLLAWSLSCLPACLLACWFLRSLAWSLAVLPACSPACLLAG